MKLDEIKLYLKIDGTDEDDLLEAFKKAAEDYLVGAGIEKDYDKGTYGLTIKLLVSHWYTNRSVSYENKSQEQIPFGVRALIQQLQFVDKRDKSENI